MLVIVIGLALVVLAAGCDFQGTWAAPVTLPPPPGAVPNDKLDAVSCVPSGVCVAAGTRAFRWNGTVWNPLPSPPARVTVIACANGTDCLAIAGKAVHHFDGTTWTPTTWPTDAAPSAIACPSPTMCVVVGYSSTGPESRRWNGTTMSPLTFGSTPVRPTGVSCPTTTFCLAVGSHSGGPWAGTWNGGSTWTGRPAYFLPYPLHRVGCQSPTACIISSPSMKFQLARWDGTQVIGDQGQAEDFRTFGWGDLACAADLSLTCLGTRGFAESSRTSGASFIVGLGPTLGVGDYESVADIACATSTECVVVGESIAATRAAWHLKNGAWSRDTFTGPSYPDPHTDLLSCPTSTFCMAVGTHAFGWARHPDVSVWDGGSWTVTTLPPDTPFSDSVPTGLTCTSSTWCVLSMRVDEYASEFGSSWTDLWTWDGTAWHSRRLNGQNNSAVSCPAPQSCVGLTPTQRFTWDGTTLSTSPLAAALPARPISLSCVTSARCAAAIGNQYGYLSTTSDQVATLTDGVATVTDPPVPAGRVLRLFEVSCAGATSTFCVAVGATAPTGSSDPAQSVPYVIQYDDTTGWTVPDLPITEPGTLHGVSCPDSLECIAVGSRGAAGNEPLALAVIGRTWKLAPNPPTAGGGPVTWTDISCLPRWCTALGSTDRATSTVVASPYTWTNLDQSTG